MAVEAPEIDDIGCGFPSLTVADNLIYVTGAHSLMYSKKQPARLYGNTALDQIGLRRPICIR